MTDSAKVTKSSITKQAYWNLYNLINNRSNVPDPNSSAGTRKFVYTRMPLTGRNFAGFPFIVVSRAKPSQTRKMVSLTKSFIDFNFLVTVYTQDQISDSSGDPAGANQNELIADNIIVTLNNVSNRKSLISQGMAKLDWSVDTEEDEMQGKPVFMTEFDLNFALNLTATS